MKRTLTSQIKIGLYCSLVATLTTFAICRVYFNPEIEIYTLYDIYYIEGLKVTSETGLVYKAKSKQDLREYIGTITAQDAIKKREGNE